MRDWRIYIALNLNDEEAVLAALGHTYSHGRFSSVAWVQDGVAGNPELLLDVAAETEEGALAEAGRVYELARAYADLVPERPRFTGYSIPEEVGESADLRLWHRADEALDTGSYVEAVVAVQISCEVLARRCLDSLTKAQGMTWLGPLYRGRPTSLTDDLTRTLFNGLTGLEIQTETWWQAYRDHVQRRNGILHRGTALISQAPEPPSMPAKSSAST